MKLNNQSLLAALKGPAQLASKRSALPALNCVKLGASGGRLTIEGTNLDAYRSTSVACEGELSLTCVHAGRLQLLLNDFGDGEVELKINGGRIELSGKHNVKLPTVDAIEFPAAPEVSGQPIANVTALPNAIRSVVWAAGNAIDRPNLHGVCIRGGQASATTGGVLAIYTLEQPIEQEIFIPTACAMMLCECLESKDAALTVGETHLFATSVGGMLAIKKTELQYPAFEQLIDKNPNVIGATDAENFLHTIRPAVSMYDDSFAKTRLEFGIDGCRVTQAHSTGDFDSTIPGAFKTLRSAMNGKWLLNALDKFEGDVEFCGVDEFTPFMLRSGPLVVIICAIKW